LAWPLGHAVAGVPDCSTRIEPGTVARAALALGGTETGRADPAELPDAEADQSAPLGAESAETDPCTDARPLPELPADPEPKGAGLPGVLPAAEMPAGGAGLTWAEPREAGAESFEAHRAPGAGGGGSS